MTFRMLNLIAAAAVAAGIGSACSGQTVTGTYYFADKPFPEYMHLWQEGWSFKDDAGNKLIYARPDMPLGGYLFVYFKNTSTKDLRVTDLAIQQIKMSDALAQDAYPQRAEEKFRTSVLISKLPDAQKKTIMEAGQPVWWKPAPAIVAPGQYGKIVVRLKRNPAPSELALQVITDGGTFSAKVAVKQAAPQFGTISFSPDLKTVYLYPRHPKAGSRPVRILIDDTDVTSKSKICSDGTLGISPVVVTLGQPLKWMSYHNFRAVYADGSAAQAGIRAWGKEMVYGMWSSPSGGSDPKSATESFITEYVRHNINAVMPYVVGMCRDFFLSDEGWEYCRRMGVDRMIHWPDPKHDALFLFAMDEPDANDAAWGALPAHERLGNLGQHLVNWTRVLRKAGPNSPVLLNIDNTYKPENWYMYHQLADIPCVDPYFPEQQDFCYNNSPYYLGAHTRPTYVQGVCAISQSSGQPNPLHVILCSTRYSSANGYQGRYPTPEEKRMEVYYAVGCGAKGISYWWFPRDSFCHGLDERTPEANALWKEIGILGAEVRTAGPLITTSCPVDIPAKANKYLWVRSLLCGNDTAAVVVVNENVGCDRLGTAVRPCENAVVSVQLPSWISAKHVFEITSEGIRDVKAGAHGSALKLDLGKVHLSRFVVVTSNPGLREQLQKRYDTMFASNVKALTGDGR